MHVLANNNQQQQSEWGVFVLFLFFEIQNNTGYLNVSCCQHVNCIKRIYDSVSSHCIFGLFDFIRK